MSVPTVRIQHAAQYRLDEIYHYTLKRWGKAQARRYLQGLFDAFDGVVTHRTHSRLIFYEPSFASSAAMLATLW